MSSLRSATGNLSGTGKGAGFGDGSFRTAYLRKQAILGGQRSKTGTLTSANLGTTATTQKPLLGNYLKQKGYECGINDIVLMKNSNGFM